jgi:hypothetical protein
LLDIFNKVVAMKEVEIRIPRFSKLDGAGVSGRWLQVAYDYPVDTVLVIILWLVPITVDYF